MSDGRDVRVAILGTGAIAQIVHLPVLSGLDGVELAAVCDVDRPKAKAIASRFEVPRVFRADEEVFASDDVDAVVICTPSHLHERQAIAALEAGKHVLVERPLALDADGARRVVEAAERAGKTLMVALNNRYRPDVRALSPFLRGGELGEVFFVKAGWLNRKVRTVRPTWRHRRETAGGGVLMDLGTQALDLCLWLLGYPKVERVNAYLHPGEGMEVEDAAALMLRLENGPVVSVEVTWSLLAQRDRHYLQVLGSHGTGSVSPLMVYKEVEHGLLDVTPKLAPGPENAYTASYRQELRHFVAAARGAETLAPPRDQIELMRLVALAYRSAAEGREIEARTDFA
ncbi:MAG TPA: Gfo/Idh/MocA family oxidoreductase [Longimicrobiales bacterium]